MRLGRFGAIFVFLLFLPFMCIFQIFAGINSFAFSADFYADLVDDPRLYEEIASGLVVDQPVARELPDGEIQEAVLSIASSDALRETTTNIVRDIADAILEGRETFSFSLNISELREALVESSPAEQVLFLQAVAFTLPDCGINQQTVTVDNYPLPLCAPSSMTREQLADAFIEDRAQIIGDFPSSVTYDLNIGWGGNNLGLLELRNAMSGTMRTAGIIAMLIWAFSAWLFASNVHGRFRWLGITLLIPSVLMIIASILFGQALISTVGQATATLGAIDSGAADSVNGGLSRIGLSFFFAGFIPAVIGGLLFAYGSNRNVRDAFKRSKVIANGMIDSAPENLAKVKESMSSAIQSETAQKMKENLGNTATRAKDGLTNAINSETGQKTREGLGTASQKTKESLTQFAQSETAQKAKENLGNATTRAKDGLTTAMNSETAQKARESFGRFAQGFRTPKTVEISATPPQQTEEDIDYDSFLVTPDEPPTPDEPATDPPII